MKKYSAAIGFGILLVLASPLALTKLKTEHERLRIHNTFQKPDEVVRYYCNRDASGFVWSGLLEVERKAFTFWSEVPAQDVMFVAKAFSVQTVRTTFSEAWVEVKYDLAGYADAHGTYVPKQNMADISSPYKVTFHLRKKDSQWKIMTPHPSKITPVVVDSKFPVLRSAS